MTFPHLELDRLRAGHTARAKSVDYIELYVGNVLQTAFFFRTALGFKPIAYSGRTTGVRDRVSYVMEQNNIRLVLTSALAPNDSIAEHVNLHGDSVKDIAFTVDDAASIFAQVVKRGAVPIMEPTVLEDDHGVVVKATVAAFGDTVHSLIQRDRFAGAFLPGFGPPDSLPATTSTGFRALDHIAICLEPGAVDRQANFYTDVFGFQQLDQEEIASDSSAISSRVVQSDTGLIKLLMLEPGLGRRTSPIDEYLSFHHGAGVQHLAVACNNIVATIKLLHANGIDVVRQPTTYYDTLVERIGGIDEEIAALRELSIMVDRESADYLLQACTTPVHSRPTMFFKLIQRLDSRRFGSGKSKALLQTIE